MYRRHGALSVGLQRGKKGGKSSREVRLFEYGRVFTPHRIIWKIIRKMTIARRVSHVNSPTRTLQ